MSTIAIETVEIDFLDTDHPEGVAKRLAAAVRSASQRGSVDWTQYQVSWSARENAFDCNAEDKRVIFRVIIASQAGQWNGGGRAYWFEGDIFLEQDAYGVLRIWASGAQVTVVGRNRTEATRFSGHGANYALAQAYRQVVLRDLGITATTRWATGQCDSLNYAEWAKVLEIPEQASASAEAPAVPMDDEPMPEWGADLLK